MFFSGQGPTFAAPIDVTTGKIGAMFDLGNLASVELALATTEITDKESKSGNRLVAARVETEVNTKFTIVLKEPVLANLELMVRGTRVSNTGAAVVDEINSQSNLAVGDFLITKFQNISAITVKDSAGSPATLVLNTDYSVESVKFGRLKILNLGTYVQPFKVSYTYANRVIVPFFNRLASNYFIHMEGINTIDSTNFLAQLYNTRVSPAEAFPLLNDEFGRYTLTGSSIIDPFRESDPNFGRFGRLVNPL